LWNGVSRVAANVWHTAQKTPALPESVFRNCDSSVANAIPVPLSDVGLKFGSTRADSTPVRGSTFTSLSGTLSM